MKIRVVSVLCLIFICVSLVACGGEPKRPIDQADSKWTCGVADISFSVSKDCEVTDATMVNKNGEKIDISIVFPEDDEGKVSITNPDGTETYITGTCSYEKDKFTVTVTDIYNTDLEITSTRLNFERQ